MNKLSRNGLESNYKFFFKQLTTSENKNIRDALYKYLICDQTNMCDRFTIFYDNYGYFIEEQLQNNMEYRKKIWAKYLENSAYNRKPWYIFEIYCKHNLLNEQELYIFFNEILKDNYKVRRLVYEDIMELLVEKGFSKALYDKVENINYHDFSTANDCEDYIFCAIRYCEIKEKLYEDTLFLLKQRHAGTTIYDTINKLLNDNSIKNKYLEYENVANRRDISSYFGW